MTRRTFEVIDIVEVLVHWHAGRKKAEVAEEPRGRPRHRQQVRRPRRGRGLLPGADQPRLEQWGALVAGWFPELVDPTARSRTHDAIEVHRELIAEMLTTNTAATVHQRLRDEHGLAVGLSSFRRYVWREFPDENLRNIATLPRPEVPAGEEAQIDYGYLGQWFDPVDREDAAGLGVRHGAGLQSPHVRAPGARHGPARLDGVPRRGVRVLRRRCPPTRAGQS